MGLKRLTYAQLNDWRKRSAERARARLLERQPSGELRTGKPGGGHEPGLRRKPINKVSKKQAVRLSEYRTNRKKVMAEQGACWFARNPEVAWFPCLGMLTVHHIVSRARGGKHDKTNLVVLCEGCHDSIHHTVEGRRTAKRLGLLKRNPERVTHA